MSSHARSSASWTASAARSSSRRIRRAAAYSRWVSAGGQRGERVDVASLRPDHQVSLHRLPRWWRPTRPRSPSLGRHRGRFVPSTLGPPSWRPRTETNAAFGELIWIEAGCASCRKRPRAARVRRPLFRMRSCWRSDRILVLQVRRGVLEGLGVDDHGRAVDVNDPEQLTRMAVRRGAVAAPEGPHREHLVAVTAGGLRVDRCW